MFQGKNVVITGAGRGIGRRLAVGFAEQGATVLVHYAHTRQGAEETVQHIRSLGGTAIMAQADISQQGEVQRLVEEARQHLGAIDVWINNAGASANTRETQGMSESDIFTRMMQVDVHGTWRCCREGIAIIRDGGSIINIGWDGALAGAPGLVNQLYAMSKGAIISLTKCLAQEYAPRVTVNCIAPGFVENDWSQSLSPAARQRLIQHTPMQRWGTADDILGTALFLASSAASYITGQVILVNGGGVMH